MPFILIDDKGEGYSGKTYIHQGCYFACYVHRSEAKRYKSKKVAENSAAKLVRKVGCEFRVYEVSE